ncbi:autophagy-related protein 13-domain-containing protein [Ephemerocybe angulata]|uniref:Autophagy-related protein 13 n=1 Tax=Ephemerocybe angulata TaxID=980116 RepID=A0A8H6HC74_9AGAR|nr:autophagy-related protein 13-domain-containing protein [Tulosesus angulatus]
MSNDIQKADQIAFHFYTKLFYVVNQARATAEPRTQGKIDKWFNLETQDSDLFTREAREPYKNISQAPPPGPPPLEIQVVLTVPELAHNQVLVYLTPDSSRARIEPTPKLIVLETYTLTFAPHTVEPASIDVALPTIYKHGIPLFRSLFSLLRVLPAWKLYKRLKRRIGGGGWNSSSRHLGIELRVRPTRETARPSDILTFDVPPSPSLSTPFATQTHVFSKVPHPLGTLALTVRYLSTPEFQLEELESVLSSRFISQDLDAGEGFVPTLTKNHQRDSSIASLSSTTNTNTNTRSPPKNIIARSVSTGPGDGVNVAERFILPARTASNPGASVPVHVQLQPARQTASGDFVGYGAATGGMAQSPSSGLAMSRIRKESMGSSASGSFRDSPSYNPNPSASSLSSSPSTGPMAIRRPNLNTVHPFKSNTVLSSSAANSSSSPSLSIRQGPLAGSPLSNAGLALAASAHGHSRSTSVSSTTAATATAGAPSSYTSNTRHPPSPIGIGFARPIPPANAPPGPSSSSFSDKRPGTSGSTGSGGSALDDRLGDGVAIPRRKRYSSSFGHRYASSVGSQGGGVEGGTGGSGPNGSSGRGTPLNAFNMSTGSTGSNPHQPGSAGLGIEGMGGSGGERDSTLAASFLSTNTNTDDDDISGFVQDIDARKPLSGRWKEREDLDRRRVGRLSDASSASPERRRLGIGLPGQAHDREKSDPPVRQPLATGGRYAPSAAPPSPTASGPSSRFSTATGSSSHSSTTVMPGSTATVVGVPVRDAVDVTTSTSPPELSMSPARGPMLTSHVEVEERLRKMNETFIKSLEGVGSNEVRRMERDRKREREREKDRERLLRERERDTISRRSSGEGEGPSPAQAESSSRPHSTPREARESGGTGIAPTSRGLSFRPLASPAVTSPTSPVTSGGAGEDYAHRRGGLRDDGGGDNGGPGRWVPYSLGMGLRRGYGDGGSDSRESNSGSASMLSQGGSTNGEGQGSEEVIGRMDIMYEGPRSREAAYRDRR